MNTILHVGVLTISEEERAGKEENLDKYLLKTYKNHKWISEPKRLNYRA